MELPRAHGFLYCLSDSPDLYLVGGNIMQVGGRKENFNPKPELILDGEYTAYAAGIRVDNMPLIRESHQLQQTDYLCALVRHEGVIQIRGDMSKRSPIKIKGKLKVEQIFDPDPGLTKEKWVRITYLVGRRPPNWRALLQNLCQPERSDDN